MPDLVREEATIQQHAQASPELNAFAELWFLMNNNSLLDSLIVVCPTDLIDNMEIVTSTYLRVKYSISSTLEFEFIAG